MSPVHSTTATDFPILSGFDACLNTPPPASGTTSTASCSGPAGPTDAFVAKFNPNGTGGQSSLVYSTYLGGTGDDHGIGIAVDSGFNAYVTGWTTSTDVLTNKPLGSGITSFQSTLAGGKDAFIAKIAGSATTSSTIFALNYFSYLGGTTDDLGLAIVADTVQNVRVAGVT